MHTLSPKDMLPIDVLKPVPSVSRPKVAEEQPLYDILYSVRPSQVMPSQMDIEEFRIELVDSSTGNVI